MNGLRIAILGEPSGWHATRLAAALTARGHHTEIVAWSRLTAAIGPDGEAVGPTAVSRADLIAVRGMPGGGPREHRLEEVIFRMNLLGRIASRGVPVLNAPRSLEVAIDKHLSLCRMAAAGIPVPATRVAQDAAAALAAWHDLGGDCLLKPLFGSRGRGIVRVRSREELAAAIALQSGTDQLGGVLYLQQFIAHPGWDARILLVGDRPFAMRRRAAAGEWRTNISCGGQAEHFAAPAGWLDLARRAAAAVGTLVAGVDVLPGPDGEPVVVEVNGVPGWKGMEAATGADVTGAVANHLEMSVRQET